MQRPLPYIPHIFHLLVRYIAYPWACVVFSCLSDPAVDEEAETAGQDNKADEEAAIDVRHFVSLPLSLFWESDWFLGVGIRDSDLCR